MGRIPQCSVHDSLASLSEDKDVAISLLCPTRGRPEILKRMIQSAKDTASEPDAVEIVIYVDDDDLQTAQIIWPQNWNVKAIVAPRIVLAQTWNKCAEVATGQILCQANDDVIWRTPGW